MQNVVEVRPGVLGTALRRRWWLPLLGALLGTLLGLAAAAVREPSYAATAAVFLNPLDGNPYSSTTSTARNDQLAAFETEASVAKTTAVGELAEELADGVLDPSAQDSVSVAVPSNSQVLQITFQAADPETARIGAQAFADAYLEYRRTQATAYGERQAARLQEQIASTSTVLDEVTTALAQAEPGSANELLLGQQVQVYASQLAQLQVQVAAVSNSSLDSGEVITPADLPSSPSGFSPLLLLAALALLGLAAGVVGAVWLDHSDTRVRDAADLPVLGAGHVLATIPSSDRTTAPALLEAFRVLRTAVLAELYNGRPAKAGTTEDDGGAASRVLCVTGTSDTDDTRFVATGLAEALERTGRRVALVLADGASGPYGRVPTLDQGLSDLLLDQDSALETALSKAIVEVKPGFLVLGAGRWVGDEGDLFQTGSLQRLLDRLRSDADVVVLSAPPVARAAGQALALAADGAVLVARLDRTRFDDIIAAREDLDQRHARTLGIAVIEPPRSALVGRSKRQRSSSEQQVLELGSGATAPALEAGPPIVDYQARRDQERSQAPTDDRSPV